MGWLQRGSGYQVLSTDSTEYVLIVIVLCEQGIIYTPPVGDVVVHVALANVTVEFDSLCVEEQACETVMVPCDYC
jgi:hypothetical protein